MIQNYDDFCRELLKAGFTLGSGGNDEGVFTLLEHGWDELTVAVRKDERIVPTTGKDHELSVEISLPLHMEPNLRDPVPIPPPNYTNRTLARSVRQVDLHPIIPSASAPFPVSDSYPQEALPFIGMTYPPDTRTTRRTARTAARTDGAPRPVSKPDDTETAQDAEASVGLAANE